VFAAELGATPRITGGRKIAGWRGDPDGEQVANWAGVCPQQLFVNAVRRERPSLPADGWFYTGRSIHVALPAFLSRTTSGHGLAIFPQLCRFLTIQRS
jgi:hypothetical protein